ncbi:2,3-diaminopropionate biosynthesis protein SbnA [Chitinophaga polysaccharea]|uniref:2,3-diaminopropionate biosynthesis protein SbnA n=1 Tax=Chitinophaga TaxID=79328 RepID=UPI001454F95A|nr:MULTISPECIES: 2,3-diaminopropionate biosynthesis protein SbnA [Chitinophaga]NLR57661.1 2,3-diaminopropionate biosynthesis protein SbnA [Chitinophaga polysaccharea]NLU93253.1 2,3-diaminopropionate biosynthesis protein SbnA [Chitinophaga sp. Ak27]
MVISSILEKVGNTPVVKLDTPDLPDVNLFCKLEYYNPTGSVKDRAAYYILQKCLEEKIIDQDTTIIESSSGNFGVALAAYCKLLSLKFICVIDPTISPINEMLIGSNYNAEICKVTTTDRNGGYLLTRIEKVKELKNAIGNSYWINQYGNELNAEAYYKSLGEEICADFSSGLDYVFLGVSSGGTITGASRKIKERFPEASVIAVDMEGSVIFGAKPMKRSIPGIGSSMVPDILKGALIDEVVWVSEADVIANCQELLSEYSIFSGGSSGAVYAAMKQYFSRLPRRQPVNVLCVLPDRGERYCNTIYNKTWCDELLAKGTILID